MERDRDLTEGRSSEHGMAVAPTSPLRGGLWFLAFAVGLFDVVVAILDFVVRPTLGPGIIPALVVLGALAVVPVLATRGRLVGPHGLEGPRAPSGWPVMAQRAGFAAAVPIAVHVGAAVVEIFWDGPPPPASPPWRASPHGFVWESERHAHPRDVTGLVAHSTFVSVGPAPHGELLLNLSAFRSVALTGDVEWAVARAADLESQLRDRPDDVELVVVSLGRPAGARRAWKPRPRTPRDPSS